MADFDKDPCNEGDEGSKDVTQGDGTDGKGKIMKQDSQTNWNKGEYIETWKCKPIGKIMTPKVLV